jgi:hypothetical protein
MKTTTRMAALMVTIALIAGCRGGMRHTDRPLRDSVRLPSAPALEPSPTTPAGPGLPGTSAPMPPAGAAERN